MGWYNGLLQRKKCVRVNFRQQSQYAHYLSLQQPIEHLEHCFKSVHSYVF